MEKSITTFQNYLEVIKPKIDERIKYIAEDQSVDPDVVPLLLKGKRMRGGLLMLVYESLSQKDEYNKALDLACAVEFAHSASLILDDMIDEDETRRGLPTVHITHGHKKAMLETIGILSLPYKLASSIGTSYTSMLADTQRRMVSGAVKELFENPDLPASKLYDMIITHKTGRLFSLAAKWGGMFSLKLPEESPTPIKIGEYGLHCGKAMQISDDITDLYKIMDGKKTSNFGSEMLLLSCVGIDGLAKEFVHDLKKRDLDFTKITNLKHTIHNTLVGMHDKEIEESISYINEISHLIIKEKNEERLISAPRDIVTLVKGSDDKN